MQTETIEVATPNTPFEEWWYSEGSGMPPAANEDHEEHIHRLTSIAWENGAYKEREIAESAHRQLEAWETSAKLRDDGLCPTQREVIADQQVQIERLEALRDELVAALKGAAGILHAVAREDINDTESEIITPAEEFDALITKTQGGAA